MRIFGQNPRIDAAQNLTIRTFLYFTAQQSWLEACRGRAFSLTTLRERETSLDNFHPK